MYTEKQVYPVKSCDCSSSCKAKPSASKRPKSSGKEITSHTFIEEIEAYEQEKEHTLNEQTVKKQTVDKQINKKVGIQEVMSSKKSKGTLCISRKPSTNGIVTHTTLI
ncbi:hypothetical protein DPMN_089356 [Dreissena polymorpha]|uniref:Uncharacterized protein n=1 Tax=Dreissena polymorpha TaxID=45954 RepID=A0A9D4KWM1_DREPO|nr:hypothetical protein DPMN_089356 [Dreissena polymorpha]